MLKELYQFNMEISQNILYVTFKLHQYNNNFTLSRVWKFKMYYLHLKLYVPVCFILNFLSLSHTRQSLSYIFL